MSAKRCLRLEPLEDRRLLAGWVFGIGGSEFEPVRDVAVDDNGSSYVVGGFDGTIDFDPGPGSTLLTGDGYSGFVARYSSDKALLWVRHLRAPGGWPNKVHGGSVAIDTDGNAYITGFFHGTAQFGDTTLVSPIEPTVDADPSEDIFVSKLNANGEFQWTVRYGGVWDEWAQDIAVDDEGDVYLTGEFEGTVEFGDTSLTSEQEDIYSIWEDIFIAKLDGTDGHAIWAHRAGTAGPYEYGSAVVASEGDIYVVGQFSDTVQFGNTTLLNEAEYRSSFVTKLDAASGQFLWARELGRSENGGGTVTDLAVDSAGNVCVVGLFGGTRSFDQYELIAVGGLDGYVTKIDNQGNYLWAQSVGGVEYIAIGGVVATADGTLYLMGYFRGTADFDPGPGTTFRTSEGQGDSFVLKLDAEGRYLDMWQLRGPERVTAQAIEADPAGNCYVAGYFAGTARFPDGTLASAGGSDGFLMKLGDAVIHRIDAQADTYDVDEDQTLDVSLPGVLENDTHSQGLALTATLADEPSHGTLTLNADGSFVYEPNPDFHGSDSFTYLASDGDIDSSEATVTITVDPVNDAPLAVDNAYTTDVNVALLPLAPGLLENDEDVEGDSLTAIIVTEPAHFLAFNLNSDGSFAYFPETGYQGPDSFTYKVNDGQADSNVATVAITVGTPRHPGDADLSGATDLSDFNIWNANKFIQGTDWTTGDFNDDGTTDLSDFNIWNAHKFTQAPAPTPAHDVVLQQAALEPAATIAELADLLTIGRKDDARQEAESAVDLLLASYWQ